MTTEPNDAAPSDAPEQELESPRTEDREIAVVADPAEPAPAPVDDTEEVEHEGQKYRVPRAVKPLLMLHSDYTRKAQELADKPRGLDPEPEPFTTHPDPPPRSTQPHP